MKDDFTANDFRIYNGTNNNAVVIITGVGGTLDGYNGKYGLIANNITTKYGSHVFIFRLKSGAWQSGEEFLQNAMKKVDTYFAEKEVRNYTVKLMGISMGAAIVASYGYKIVCVNKILSINPVLQVNPHKQIYGIENAPCQTIMVLGALDPSYKFVSMLDKVSREKLSVVIVPTADHQFTGDDNFSIFIELPDKYLF